MSLVVDASLVAGLVLPLPYSENARQYMLKWKRQGQNLLAPLLIEYEITTVLRRAVAVKQLDNQIAKELMREILALNIQMIAPDLELHTRALDWAMRLNQSKAYDSLYLALAEQLNLPLWTADLRLANHLIQLGVNWVFPVVS